MLLSKSMVLGKFALQSLTPGRLYGSRTSDKIYIYWQPYFIFRFCKV